ncbi:39S ribosomal protein L2, mitochondrial-like [Homarus americanus]|uniref:39S ribosomal protein L2, mitochondrial-like n=1 Tax=Homarus americanus TaxID=6706 RepID=UPI001C463EF8|nr:39S ribosomal protein L2, mitochondrial-like [Homarus americanus]
MVSVMAVGSLCRGLGALTLRSGGPSLTTISFTKHSFQQVRSNYNIHYIDQPAPGDHKNYRYKVHFPEDGQYTVKPLKTTKLGGRDPETGRIIVGTLGGGAKRNYRWIDWFRYGPKDGTFLEERVIKILYDPNRSARIALVAHGDNLRYIIATENMASGDLIKTSSYIPRIPVRPKEGDAYPVGALPTSTIVNCLEIKPGDGARFIKAAGTGGIIMRRIGKKVVVQLPTKREVALDPECMATVGRVSNVDHGKKHVGSAQRRRWLGRRPASGLWQRKTGYNGRKIRPLPPIKSYGVRPEELPVMRFTIGSEGPSRRIIPSTDRVT